MANTHINQFMQSLSDTEIRLVEDHLQKLRSLTVNNSEEIKYQKLFKLFVSNKNREITDEEIIKATNVGRCASLKTNLYYRVLEAFCLDKYITNRNVFNENDIISFRLKKQLLIFKVLYRSPNHGKTEALNELLNEIIDVAKEYEIYDVLVEALRIKKYFKGIRSGIKEFEICNEQIKFYNYCAEALYYAADCYYRIILNSDLLKSTPQAELDKYINSCIKKMKVDYKKTNSQQVNYYLHIILCASCESKKQYKKTMVYCNKIINILENNKAIYKKERMGFVLDDFTRLYIYTHNYKKAAKDAKKAQEYYTENSFNYFISKEQEFYAYLYNNDLQQALECIEKLLQHTLIDTGEFRKSKYIYYKACVLFLAKKYATSYDLLKMSLEIEMDKSRWNISLRILNIMLFIELNKIEEASRALESLRKNVARMIKENSEIKKRDELIVKLLREMEKDGFNYDPKNTAVNKMLNELSEKRGPVAWEHYSTELAPFHKWLVEKK